MRKKIKYYLVLFLKGTGIGAANIIPGVSGGTIALITGLFEEIIRSIKSINIKSLKLLLTGRFKEFQKHVNFFFLLLVFGGAAIGIYLLAFILEPLFLYYPHFVWAFFFGLILASVIFVGKSVNKWTPDNILFFLAGTLIAVYITIMLKPAAENSSVWYVFICGIVAVCSMILPGLSGSYVLLLMGNYELVMIRSVVNTDLAILTPLLIGALAGLISFSHLLAWVFRRFRDQTIAVLVGFIFGSLGILWPWKNEITRTFESGKEAVIGYDWYLPDAFSSQVLFSILLMIMGFVLIWLVEKLASVRN